MKWFGRKSAGRGTSVTGPRPVLARGWGSWSPDERPWCYEREVRAGYIANPVAQRAVRLVAEGVGSAPLVGAVPEALALVGARTAGQALLETVAMQLLLHGNAFVRVLGSFAGTPSPRSAPGESLAPGTRDGLVPTDLFALRPERVGGALWRLSELHRGRCGTEAAIATHSVDETFSLIEAATIRVLSREDAVAGALIEGQGVGDAAPVAAVVETADRALLPLSPVRLTAFATDDGMRISWIRRSRDGFIWRDGVDAPVAEEREAYHVLATGGGASVSVEVTAPDWLLPTGLVAPGTSMTVTVRQIGAGGLSDPIAATMEL